MKSAWGTKLYDTAAWNTAQVEEEEEVNLLDFEQMLVDDFDMVELDEDQGEH